MTETTDAPTPFIKRGVPWSADVDRIMQKFPELPDGLEIPLTEIETCIHEPRTESRFNSVVGAWRKRLEKDRNILIKKRKGVLVVLDNEGKLNVAQSGYGQGLRKLHVSGKRARGTGDRGLSYEHKRVRDHIATTAANLLCIAATEAKSISYPDPIKRLK
jgi:hypothetical protein